MRRFTGQLFNYQLILLGCFSFWFFFTIQVAQSSLTLCDPMDYTVHGILQARILERVIFPFSRGSSQPRDWTQVSCIAGGFFTSWATREALFCCSGLLLSPSFHLGDVLVHQPHWGPDRAGGWAAVCSPGAWVASSAYIHSISGQ